ncbi:mono [ADP-ribose] polymerase PARP16 [Lingula anatina]|uniref:Poly [ADP-ribose] polymerase n=1 Tax=Lingula anatina TaxID=7574 RepID=A0A1S3J6V0_LINAN|nr:mono [ADP-ribose] polymerase PARP16 [Lingula anatina]|eukprot:XP_013406038.1 mono [ADP-ribose] polymerase PARP16 [Lingula anatina]
MAYANQLKNLLAKVREDPLAADMHWSLFMSALQSYRHDTVLRPFPPKFQEENSDEKDYKALTKLANQVPNIEALAAESQVDDDTLQLLSWAVLERNFHLKTCDKTMYQTIQTKAGQIVPVPAPNYIFEVEYNQMCNEKFEKICQGRDLIYAYHGSRVENFHSILNLGLHSHMNKTSLFGEGTYLSSELSVSIVYSPAGQLWESSMLGSGASIIALCEIIDDPTVKCQVKGDKEESGKARRRVKGSMGGDVPEKYYVVQNNEMLRVKYLLVYVNKQFTRTATRNSRISQPSWLAEHKFLMMVLCYALLLVAIGLANSKSLQQYMRRLR